jgi:hypothetical protein
MSKPPADALNLRPRITIHRKSFPEVHSYLEAIPADQMSAVISGLVIRAVIGLTQAHGGSATSFTDGGFRTPSPSNRHEGQQTRLHEPGPVSRESEPPRPQGLGVFGAVGSDAFDYSHSGPASES